MLFETSKDLSVFAQFLITVLTAFGLALMVMRRLGTATGDDVFGELFVLLFSNIDTGMLYAESEYGAAYDGVVTVLDV